MVNGACSRERKGRQRNDPFGPGAGHWEPAPNMSLEIGDNLRVFSTEHHVERGYFGPIAVRPPYRGACNNFGVSARGFRHSWQIDVLSITHNWFHRCLRRFISHMRTTFNDCGHDGSPQELIA